jgi:multiple sugar transport system substrate-binding protein
VIIFVYYPTEESYKITKIYFADNISSAHTAIINKFNQEYENKIEVVPIDLPFSKFTTNERKELLARTLRGKSYRIDIFAVDLIWVQRFARWAEPLDLYFPSMERDNILEPAMQSCYANGNLVAMPFYIDVGLMYYRDDILQTFTDYNQLKQKIMNSITWEEFLNLSARINKQNSYTYLFAADNFEGLVCSYLELLYGQKQSIFEGDSINLNTTAAVKALNLLVDLVHYYGYVPKEVDSFDEFQCYLYALENDVPFFRGWPGLHQQYYGKIPHYEKLNGIKTAPLPHFKGFKSSPVFGGWNLMIPNYSNKKSEAVEFIRFLLKKENQLILYKKSGFLPVSDHVYNDSANPVVASELEFYRKLLDNGFHRPFLADYTKISDVISFFVNRAIKKELSANEALNQATKLINSKQVLIK